MQDNENMTTNSSFRSTNKYFRVFGIVVLLMVVIAIVLIVIQVQTDLKIRNQISTQVWAGQNMSRSILTVFRNEDEFWPQNAEDFSQSGIEVLDEGLVRVYFERPASIKGKWADLKLSIENGRYYLSCKAPGIKSVQLPGWCREDGNPIEIRLPEED